jgi:hypothetical protein
MWAALAILAVAAPVGKANASVESSNAKADIARAAVGPCLDQVHQMKLNQDVMLSFYRDYDAYFSRNEDGTWSITDNGFTVGAQEPRYYFRKCLTDHGVVFHN